MAVVQFAVDANALINNLENIKKGVEEETIKLFVPRCVFEDLHRLSKRPIASGGRAQDAIYFINDAKTKLNKGSVDLQSSEEKFGTWDEFEDRAFPGAKSSFGPRKEAVNNGTLKLDLKPGHDEGDISSLSSANSANKRQSSGSSATTKSTDRSPERFGGLKEDMGWKASLAQAGAENPDWFDKASPQGRNHSRYDRSTSDFMNRVPESQRSFCNAVVWKCQQTPQERFGENALQLLSDDRAVNSWAWRAGIKVVTLKEFVTGAERKKQHADLREGSVPDRREDVLLFKPRGRRLLPPIGSERKSPSIKSSDGGVLLVPTENLPNKPNSPTQSPIVENPEHIPTLVIHVDSFSRDLPLGPVNRGSRTPDIKEKPSGHSTPPASGVTEDPVQKPTTPKGPKASPRGNGYHRGERQRPIAGPSANGFRRQGGRGVAGPSANGIRRREEERPIPADVDFTLNSGAPRSESHAKGRLWLG